MGKTVLKLNYVLIFSLISCGESYKGLYQICSKGLFLGRFIFSIINFGSDDSGVFCHHIYMLKRPQTSNFCPKKGDHMTTYDHHSSIYGEKDGHGKSAHLLAS